MAHPRDHPGDLPLSRSASGIDGPLFLGIDTHALSIPAFATALEVLAANGVEADDRRRAANTRRPRRSRTRSSPTIAAARRAADGIVITPSHNPPHDGGFKYNPPERRPGRTRAVTGWIEAKANALLEAAPGGREAHSATTRALRAPTTHRHDLSRRLCDDLGNVVDLDAIRGAKLRLGVDPLGGAGVHYWGRIAERHRLDLTVVNDAVDPTFRFMTVDWDGQIRMDPSSPYAMQRLIGMKDRFDLSFACDTDHDRHGIVTKERRAAAAQPLPCASRSPICSSNRPNWRKSAAVGKTVVSSQMIDRVAAKLGRKLYEVPVGFKWFVAGLLDGSLGFGGEESAGASFLRLDGSVWTTDKDGFVPCLLAAEITARTGRDPGEIYRDAHARIRRSALRPRRGAGHAGREGRAGKALARSRSRPPSWPGDRSWRSSPGPPATARRSAG